MKQIYNKGDIMRIVQINTVCNTGSTGKIALDLYEIAEQADYECLGNFLT